MILKCDGIKAFAPRADSPKRERVTLNQRLLAEAVRLHEESQGFPIEDSRAETLAREGGGDLETRVIVRAQALAIAPALHKALQQLRNASRLAIGVSLIAAALAGLTTARVVLGSPAEGPINFFRALGSILAVPTFTMLLWVILMVLGPSTVRAGSLGAAVLALGGRISRWLHKGPMSLAAMRAGAAVFVRSGLGRWLLSALSHSLWLTYLSACLVVLLLMLSTQQYTFGWETTILSERSYLVLTRSLASLPEMLGFSTPDAQQIIASHWTRTGHLPGESREAWSGLLIGSIVAYGLLPRALLLGLSLLGARQARLQFRLDMSKPGFMRLRSHLMPPAQTLGVVEAEIIKLEGRGAEAAQREPPPCFKAEGRNGILGLEIEAPRSAWPPPLAGVEWLDLGFVDSRSDRQRVQQQIGEFSDRLRLIVVVCSLPATPDRGTRAFIGDLQASARVPVVIVLTEGQRLRSRDYTPQQLQERIEDWHRLARAAQVTDERVIELDLDHFTAASREKLATLLGLGRSGTASASHLEQSFALIIEHIGRWQGEPSVVEQAELQRAIALLYSGEGQSWQMLLRIGAAKRGDLLMPLKKSAEGMVNLLPGRLRRDARWLAAGAMAGALACVVAATLVTPAAIAALPAWAGLGTAVAAIVKWPRQTPAGPAEPDLTQAVRSAALFAVVLELQGREEVAITRILDCTVMETDAPIDGPDAAREWLATLRQRFVLAVSAEAQR